MPRLVNQSSIDENFAMFLQFGLSEDSDLTVNDDVISREIQQQYPNNSDLTANDDVIAREIQQQYQNNWTYDDTAIALEIQKQEGT